MAWKYSSKYLNGSIFLVFFGSSIIFQIHFKYLSLKEKQLQFFNWHFIFRKNKNLNVKYMVSVAHAHATAWRHLKENRQPCKKLLCLLKKKRKPKKVFFLYRQKSFVVFSIKSA